MNCPFLLYFILSLFLYHAPASATSILGVANGLRHFTGKMLTGQARRNSGRHASFTSSEIESLAGLPETNLVTVIQRSTVANNYEESLVDALCNDELREYFEKNPFVKQGL